MEVKKGCRVRIVVIFQDRPMQPHQLKAIAKTFWTIQQRCIFYLKNRPSTCYPIFLFYTSKTGKNPLKQVFRFFLNCEEMENSTF